METGLGASTALFSFLVALIGGESNFCLCGDNFCLFKGEWILLGLVLVVSSEMSTCKGVVMASDGFFCKLKQTLRSILSSFAFN